MCAACGTGVVHIEPDLDPDLDPDSPPLTAPGGTATGSTAPGSTATRSTAADSTPPPRFVALRTRDVRFFLGGTLLSMMADNVEQYISQCT